MSLDEQLQRAIQVIRRLGEEHAVVLELAKSLTEDQLAELVPVDTTPVRGRGPSVLNLGPGYMQIPGPASLVSAPWRVDDNGLSYTLTLRFLWNGVLRGFSHTLDAREVSEQYGWDDPIRIAARELHYHLERLREGERIPANRWLGEQSAGYSGG